MKAEDALLAIQEAVDGVAWTPDSLKEIAAIMRSSGYRIRDIDGSD